MSECEHARATTRGDCKACGVFVTGAPHLYNRQREDADAARAAFERYATRSEFVEWVIIEERERYAIVRPYPSAGLQWVRIGLDRFNAVEETRRSSGAFYDGVDDHPEGALEWARAAAHTRAAIVRKWHEEVDVTLSSSGSAAQRTA